MLLTKKSAIRAILALTLLIVLPSACSSRQEEAESTEPIGLLAADGGGETVVIRPQEPLIAQHAEVTVSLSFDREQQIGKIEVDPETAVIFYEPKDPRLVTQVLWRVECLMDRKLVSCPAEAVKSVVITRKEGCPDLFGTEAFEIPGDKTAIASGRVKEGVYDVSMKAYQAQLRALIEKDRSLSATLVGCSGERLHAAPEEIDPYRGLTWQYTVTVYLANGEKRELDPEIWIERDKDP